MNLLELSAPLSTPRPPGAKLYPGPPPMVEAAKAQEAHTGEETGDRSLGLQWAEKGGPVADLSYCLRPGEGRNRMGLERSLFCPPVFLPLKIWPHQDPHPEKSQTRTTKVVGTESQPSGQQVKKSIIISLLLLYQLM